MGNPYSYCLIVNTSLFIEVYFISPNTGDRFSHYLS
nr:MAG TPA: hypothetical protein [Bacteriophage sp.]